MRGYITQENSRTEKDKVEQNQGKKNRFFKIEFGIIILLTVISALYIFPLLSDSIEYWNLMIEESDEWTFIHVYGKGFIPGLLLCVVSVIGNILLLCKRRIGFWLMSLLSVPIIMPTILNEYEEVVYFSASIFSIMLVYYIVLRIPNKNKSYWGNIKQGALYLRNLCITIWAILVVFIIVTPFVLAKQVGFYANMYSNGQDIFNAKYGDSRYFYYNRIAKKMAENKEIIATQEETIAWFEMSLQTLNHYRNYNDEIYLDYADFLESIGEYGQAYMIYKKADKLFNTDDTSQKLKGFLNEHTEFEI